MRLLVWASDRRHALIAAYGKRRMFRGAHLTPAAQRWLREATKRRTP